MRYLSIFTIISLITSTLAAPLPANGPVADAYTQLIINDIGNIDKAVKHLTTQIKAYQGGTLAASPFFTGVLDIHLVNRKAFVDAIPPVHANNEQSKKIVEFTEDSVGVSIPASVQALEAKKAQLEAADVAEFVVPGLKLLKKDHLTYSAELLRDVSPDYLARGQAVVKKIADAIQGGIDDFSS